MKLADARVNINRGVVYTAPHGIREAGVITSVNDSFVFVRYGADKGSRATPADQLELESGGAS